MVVDPCMVLVCNNHHMVIMRQTIDGTRRWSESHGYRWRYKGAYGKSGHRNRDAELDSSPPSRQHANFARPPPKILTLARPKATPPSVTSQFQSRYVAKRAHPPRYL